MRYFAKIEDNIVSNLVGFDENGLPENIEGIYVEYTQDKLVYIGLHYDESQGFLNINSIPEKPKDGKTYYLQDGIWTESV